MENHGQGAKALYAAVRSGGLSRWALVRQQQHLTARPDDRWHGVQVLTTISRGRIAWHDGKILVASGSSRFVATPPGGSLFNGGVIAGSEPHSAPTKSASPGSDEL